MAELTIQVPDELAIRLEPLRSRLPELLLQLLETANSSWETHILHQVPRNEKKGVKTCVGLLP